MTFEREGKKERRKKKKQPALTFWPFDTQISDIILIVNSILSISELSGDQAIAADITSDGLVNILVRWREAREATAPGD